jgi:purine-binding chemotaxis protein CheW
MSTAAQARAAERPQYLTFGIDEDEFAIGIRWVREVLPFPKVTRVPETPAWIRGVMHLRGSVVVVIDFRAKFGFGESPVTRTTCAVVLEAQVRGEACVVAAMVDRICRVLEIGDGELLPAPSFGTRVPPDCLLGLVPAGERLACVLDVERVLSSDDILAVVPSTDAVDQGPDDANDRANTQPAPEGRASGTIARRRDLDADARVRR